MTCIVPERFIDLLDERDLDRATPDEGVHLAACASCRETWARLAGADLLLRDRPVAASRESRVLAVFAAAAAVLLAVGLYLSHEAPPFVPAVKPQDPKVPVVMVEACLFRTGDDLAGGRIPAVRAAEIQVAARKKGAVIHNPKISLYDKTEGSIFVGEQVAYVAEYAVDFDDAGKPTPRAVPGNAMNGIRILALPEIGARKEITLRHLKIIIEEADKDLHVVDTSLGKIETPHVRRFTYTVTAKLPDGEWLLVGPMRKPSDDKEDPIWALVSCSVVGD